MNIQKSLYESILDGVQNGALPEDFSLPRYETEGGFSFGDGAKDGVTIFHMQQTDIDDSGMVQLIKALHLASEGKAAEADAAFAELGRSFGAVLVIDDLQQYILSHKADFNPENLHRTALALVLHSADRESVKYGLSIMELFVAKDAAVKDAVRTIGLSDEFTIFAVFNMLNWANANDEIFRLVQKVHGWGRIHTLERLEATTPEIREWMIREGIHNNIMSAYSALTVWEKANVREYMKGPITKKEYTAIGDIISAMSDEGPVEGLSALEDEAEDVLMDYLARADEFELDVDDYDNVLDIYRWAADEEYALPAAAERSMELLSTDECQEVVLKAVRDGKGVRIADALELDYADALLECMRADFDNQFWQSSYLMSSEEHIESVLELVREKLPLSQMRRDPADENRFAAGYDVYNKLEYVLQNLCGFPNAGEDIVAAGLWSPVTGVRKTALQVLEDWTMLQEQPIAEISEALSTELTDLEAKEFDDGLREKIRRLLDGAIKQDGDENR